MVSLTLGKSRPKAQRLDQDLKTLALFVQLYCEDNHCDCKKQEVEFKGFDVASIAGKPVVLCSECHKLLNHAFVKRSVCPMNPKPQCKHCPRHCYAPKYRSEIREAMKYSGRKLVMGGRIDYLIHLLF